MTEPEGMHTVVLETVKRGNQSDAEAQFVRERQAFWAMHAQLVATYEGQYVAILHGQVVDNDSDEPALGQRVYQIFGYQPMYVQYVTSGPLPVCRMLSPQIVRP